MTRADWSRLHKTAHGHCRKGKQSRTWRSWQAMRQRCYRVTDTAYADYGGRGITVCERWRSFETFLADMGEIPDGMSLDRIDNNGNYEPSNCRWADWRTQMRNQRKTVLTVEKVREARRLLRAGATCREVAAQVGATMHAVYDVSRGRTWKEIQ